jgi:hypothetical protein
MGSTEPHNAAACCGRAPVQPEAILMTYRDLEPGKSVIPERAYKYASVA